MYASVASGGEADYLSRYNSSPPFWASAMRSFSLGTASRHTFAVSCVRRGGEQARFSNPVRTSNFVLRPWVREPRHLDSADSAITLQQTEGYNGVVFEVKKDIPVSSRRTARTAS
jgi:hypothetical protein